MLTWGEYIDRPRSLELSGSMVLGNELESNLFEGVDEPRWKERMGHLWM